ncbi:MULTISPECIES: mechanosensitive ion channel family protein [Marinobacter]|uniref:Small-conductance mechanosensitive channel n=1 Tax=Marinobacter alkaliphilus TaxID=254719 RepID=A0ABZ3E7Z0_9GAMM|nr:MULTISPECIES: mechanosensitive ion channel family protein [unclassified Marinobacter]QFS85509.1 Small-conductance mechanosensitive channel [Marinobacter sp. THAF197a]QFT49303.1 Small-conductance mechanosensitive channel [Marinobacter sp. THAF39]
MIEGFTGAVGEQLKQNLGDTLEAMAGGQVDWAELAVYVFSQVLVSAIYLGLFIGGYLLIIGTLRIVVGKRRSQSALFSQVRTGLKYLFALGALLVILAQFGAGPGFLKAMARAGFMALGFFVGWLVLARLMKEAIGRYGMDPSIRQLIENLFAVLMVTFAVVAILAQFGFDVLSIVAGLGIVGIAVGFAAQSTLSNFIAGITLLIERPFRIGDWVSINGQDGKVVKIALRTTWLRTRDNIFTMIPNDSVASSDIVNYSAEGATRLNIPVGIAYKESARAAREVIMPVLLSHPEVLKGGAMEPRVVMKSLGDSSVDLEVKIWITPDNLDVQPRIMADVLEQIKEALDAAGIEIPFPHLQLFIDDAKGLKPLVEPLYPKLVEK